VTGAASGLGAALATAFLNRGDEVLLCDLAPAIDVPAGAQYQRLDVTSDADWDAARTWVEQEWGGLDILVNNAGIATGGRIDVAGMDEWYRAVEVNLLGAVRGCRTFVPLMKAQSSGTIVNIASLAGLVHPPAMASYTATKAGIVALSETLHHELHSWGIQVAVVCPGFFRTNLAASVASDDPVTAGLTTSLINRSEVSADEVAQAVLEGLDAGDHVILPDPESRLTVEAKRNHRDVYEQQQFAFAHNIRTRTGE
jgi:NAD(P)-dependent dehydrogenase (short-subunit alcohol dehydrogenase family)